MSGGKDTQFLNENAVVATGLAFAGMAVLQSKLFPACGRLSLAWLNHLVNWRVLEWWPVLLIMSGVWLWIRSSSAKSSQSVSRDSAERGGK